MLPPGGMSESETPAPTPEEGGNAREEDWTSEYDRAWKGMLDAYLQAFLAFYFPNLEKLVDWEHPPEILDTTLPAPPSAASDNAPASETPASEATAGEASKREASKPGELRVDKFFKVRMLPDREPEDSLLHIEVQGDPETGFPRRMYVYNGRAFDRFGLPVLSMALLADVDPNWRPAEEYGWRRGSCRALLEFATAKLIDYDWSELTTTSNPFGLASMAHRWAKATRARNLTAAEERLAKKLEVTRLLYAKGLPEREHVNLLRFIDLVLKLPKALARKYWAEVQQMEDRTMEEAFLASFEVEAMEKGLEKGLEKGRLRQMAMVKRHLERLYGDLPPWVVERLQRATVDQLDLWGDRLFDAPTIEKIFADE